MAANKKKKFISEKQLSLAFWLSIPSTFVLGGVCFITSNLLFDKYFFDGERWVLFGFGLVGSLMIFGSSAVGFFRVFVHELKHAVAVFLSGGRVKGFYVGANEGEVEYEIQEDSTHYVPIIGLAPYFFPLFSFPWLLAALIFDQEHRQILTLGLGFSLGADLAFCWSEIHQRQTDFRQVAGGFFAAALYISGVLFLWVNLCVLWVLAGGDGFLFAGFLLLRLVGLLTKQFLH